MRKIIIPTTILLILFTLFSSLYFSIYDYGFYKKEFERNPNLNSELAFEINSRILGYYDGDATLPDIFTDNEKAHLKDVKQLIKKAKTTYYLISIILFSSLLVLFIKDKIKEISKIFISAGITIDILTILAFLFNFSNIFHLFHITFFEGNFTFPMDSMLITLYPETFFKAMFIHIITYFLIYGNILILIGFILYYYNKLNHTKVKE